jgi:mRNA interferase RelE/StbE
MGGCEEEARSGMIWSIRLTVPVEKQLAEIRDRRIRDQIVKRINRLDHDPEKQGKLLSEDLAGYRSVRAVGERYRIIYRVEEEIIVVVVVAVGIRKAGDKKDVYELAKRLARLGLLDLDAE